MSVYLLSCVKELFSGLGINMSIGAEEDTDPGPFDLLVYLIELQSVSHLSHKPLQKEWNTLKLHIIRIRYIEGTLSMSRL